MSQPNLIDLTGQRFGRWLVLEQAPPRQKNSTETRWLCQCDCGTVKEVSSQALRRGSSRSCGCLGAERQMSKPRRRGKAEEKLKAVLISARRACENPNDGRYYLFGARGITVCDEWRKDENTFIEWSLNNGYRDGSILLRYDKEQGFAPWNCKWRTEPDKGQGRKGSVIITANDEAHSLAEWSRITGLHRDTILERLLRGATPEEAVKQKK